MGEREPFNPSKRWQREGRDVIISESLGDRIGEIRGIDQAVSYF